MSRFALAFLLVAASFAPQAHAQYGRAWVRCDAQAGELVVHYQPGDVGEPWAGASDHTVDFHDLLDLDERQVQVEGTRESAFDCRLGDDALHVVLSPVPGNANLLGSCGGDVGGMVAVSRGDVAVIDDFEFEPGECHEREEFVAKLVLRAHAKDYSVERRRLYPDE